MSPAGDVWSLGMTLVEALTQNLPVVRTSQQQDPLYPQSLGEPFLDIARHCLLRRAEGRWKLAQITARLQERPSIPQVQPLPPKAQAPIPASPRPRFARPPMLSAKVRSYATPVAIAVGLALAALLAGPKLCITTQILRKLPPQPNSRALLQRRVNPRHRHRKIQPSRTRRAAVK